MTRSAVRRQILALASAASSPVKKAPVLYTDIFHTQPPQLITGNTLQAKQRRDDKRIITHSSSCFTE